MGKTEKSRQRRMSKSRLLWTLKEEARLARTIREKIVKAPPAAVPWVRLGWLPSGMGIWLSPAGTRDRIWLCYGRNPETSFLIGLCSLCQKTELAENSEEMAEKALAIAFDRFPGFETDIEDYHTSWEARQAAHLAHLVETAKALVAGPMDTRVAKTLGPFQAKGYLSRTSYDGVRAEEYEGPRGKGYVIDTPSFVSTSGHLRYYIVDGGPKVSTARRSGTRVCGAETVGHA